jgi:hypothetical protein
MGEKTAFLLRRFLMGVEAIAMHAWIEVRAATFIL